MNDLLPILKIFFKNKHIELKDMQAYRWIIAVLVLFIVPLFFYQADWFVDSNSSSSAIAYYVIAFFIWMCVEAVLFTVIYFMYKFAKWIKSNWQKAVREHLVNKDDTF